MTKREAIRECKRMLKEIEKSGLSKGRFLFSLDGGKWRDKHYQAHCPLCEYVGIDCRKCPLVIQYNKDCYEFGFNHSYTCEPSFFHAVRGLKE